MEQFKKIFNVEQMTGQERIVQWMNFQTREYGHDFVTSTIPWQSICKYIGINTFTASDNMEYVCPNQITGVNDILGINTYKYLECIKRDPYLSLISKFKKGTSTPLGAGTFGPLTIISSMIGLDNFLKKCIKEPEFIRTCCDFFAKLIMDMAHECEKKGFDYFLIGEPVAVMISPRHFQEFSGKYIKEVFHNISIPGFLHVPGDTNHLIDEFVKTGAQCLSLDYHVNMKKLLYKIPSDVVVLGNINTISMLRDDYHSVERQVVELNRDIRNFPNVIVSSGGGVIDETPEDNLRVLFEATKKFHVWHRNEYKYINEILKVIDGKQISIDEFKYYICKNNVCENVLNSALEEATTYLSYKLQNNLIDIKEYQERKKFINVIKIG